MSLDILETKCCSNCRYFQPYVYEFDDADDHFNAEYGECRRFPPKVVSSGENGFPVLESVMWCGEFDF